VTQLTVKRNLVVTHLRGLTVKRNLVVTHLLVESNLVVTHLRGLNVKRKLVVKPPSGPTRKGKLVVIPPGIPTLKGLLAVRVRVRWRGRTRLGARWFGIGPTGRAEMEVLKR
jgi:hypothetical protein